MTITHRTTLHWSGSGAGGLNLSGAVTETANAEQNTAAPAALDTDTVEPGQAIPPEPRLLVTSHERVGSFAARSGFTVPVPGGSGACPAAAPIVPRRARLPS